MVLLASWVVHAMALMAVAYVIPGVEVEGFAGALVAALLLGLINSLVRPILTILTLPLTVLTLGLFYFVLNGLLFYWVGNLLEGLYVSGVWAAIFASLLYSILAAILTSAFLRPQVRIERINH
ncbi:MAG: phage holin family protein [Limnobacter sp.]|nr:phage holin family protein [Limnobacter sp.]